MSNNTTSKILEGVFAINKPPSISSAQVLRNLQNHFDTSTVFAPWISREKTLRDSSTPSTFRDGSGKIRHKKPKKGRISVKLGHGGTLDPLATGVLIVGVGKGTKQLTRFLECTKTYECVVLFGAATDTYDTLGKIVGRKEYAHITEAKVKEALAQFKGKQMQRPPVYSAIRVQGKHLYEYAREGKEIPKIQEREVEVLDLECTGFMPGGTHGYEWPTEDAPEEEKIVAEKLGVINADGGAVNSKKRKRSNDGEETETYSEQRPLGKLNGQESEELEPEPTPHVTDVTDANPPTHLMSGALPSSKPSSPNTTPHTTTSASTTEPPAPPPAARVRLTVTSGFYVRSLCHDLGVALGSAACMAHLVRTRQAGFELGPKSWYRDVDDGSEVDGSGTEKKTVGSAEQPGAGEGVSAAVAGTTAVLGTEQKDGTGVDVENDGYGNVLENSDLEQGEAVWGPKLERMLRAWNEENGRDDELSDDERRKERTDTRHFERRDARDGTGRYGYERNGAGGGGSRQRSNKDERSMNEGKRRRNSSSESDG